MKTGISAAVRLWVFVPTFCGSPRGSSRRAATLKRCKAFSVGSKFLNCQRAKEESLFLSSDTKVVFLFDICKYFVNFFHDKSKKFANKKIYTYL